MSGGVMVGMSACVACGSVFAFDVDAVPVINLVRDADTAKLRAAEPHELHTAMQCPICPACCKHANTARAANGLPLLREDDTAQAMLQGRDL